MNNNKTIQITKEGLATLKVELDDLVKNKRPKMVARLENAREQGDITENSDYANAKDELEFLDGRIDELTQVVNNAIVANGPSGKANAVSFGTKVTLLVSGQENVYEIVGEWEADPVNKKISHESPLGRALVGKAIGEEVEVEAPAGKVVYKIIAIE